MAKSEQLPRITTRLLKTLRRLAPGEYKTKDIFHCGVLVYFDEKEPKIVTGFKILKGQRFGVTSSRAQLFAGFEGAPQSSYSREHNHQRGNSRRNPIF